MLYEYRRYEVMPNRLGDLNKRFAAITTKIWERLEFHVVGFWTAEVGTSNELHYMLAWEDMAERERKWGAFMADKEWQEKRAETEQNGPLVARLTNSFWRPTSYSPMK
jgi:hypothetical protein